MKKAALFILDYLVKDKNGELVTNPSVSPENSFKYNGKTVSVCTSSGMDIAIINDLFIAVINSCEILRLDFEFSKKIKSALDKFSKYKIGKSGRLQEWDEEYTEIEPGHRHMSHLYGVYPGSSITGGKLLDAARKSLNFRLANGGGYTGWSCAWLINLFARFKDAENAYKYVVKLLKRSTYDNLFDAHPPFQIDGNFGFTSGVAEMLLQSHMGFIEILPALPADWINGQITGLSARGGFCVDISWEGGCCKKIVVKSLAGKKCIIKYKEYELEFETEKNQTYEITISVNKMVFSN